VHNLFPNWGTSWLKRWPGPLVATLHNFRTVCAAATLHRDGKLCVDCPKGSRWAGVRHHCYRESAVRSLPLAWQNRHGASRHPLLSRADRVITLSQRATNLMSDFGVDHEKLRLVNNFVDDPLSEVLAPPTPCGRWLYIGRLVPEKGLAEMLSHWPLSERLDIVGAGPQRALLEQLAAPSVRFLGEVPNTELLQVLPSYLGLAIPSRWPEGMPLALLEGLAAGLPIVSLGGSSAADLVRELGVGATVESDSDWPAALSGVKSNRAKLSRRAREVYENRFTRDAWLRQVLEIYRECTIA
jgi:glycosyltransferase involved in cell wall biosynthesis